MTNIYCIKVLLLLLYKHRTKPVLIKTLIINVNNYIKDKARRGNAKKIIKRCTILMLCVVMTVGLFGCNLSVNNGKRIVRIAIAQSETHPEYLGLVAFKEYVEEKTWR